MPHSMPSSVRCSEVGAVLDTLAGGDLTVQITKDYAGDFNQLKTAVNTLGRQVR